VALPTYLLVISLTYCLCIVWAYRRALNWPAAGGVGATGTSISTGGTSLSPSLVLDICLAIMLGGLVGARLLHVFYEDWAHYSQHPLDIFKLWQGGFVYDGGLIGAALVSWIFLRWRKQSFLFWADFFAPLLAAGYALGRVGCFLTGCCFGKICELPWAIEMIHPGLPTGLRHPTQLYAVGIELLIAGYILWREKKKHFAGQMFFTWLLLHGCGRIVMEFFRDDYRGPEIFGLSIATWFASLAIFIAGGFLFRQRRI